MIKKVQEEHDRNAVMYRNQFVNRITIPKNSVFRGLRKLLPEEFEWIKTKKRLVEEGDAMHHCVATYDTAINKDRSAIYSFVWEDGKRYTVEFRRKADGQYYMEQIRGMYNADCPKKAQKYVLGFLEGQ